MRSSRVRQLPWLARAMLVAVAMATVTSGLRGQSTTLPPDGSPAAPAPLAGPAGAAGPISVVPPPGHGWFVWRDSADRATVLLHLPPRKADAAGEISGRDGRADGSVRLAPGIAQSVEHIAWWQHRVYMVLQEDRTAPSEKADWLRRIVELTAVRSSVTGGWQYPPGRPVVVATMGARSREVLAFGACRLGPVALLRHGARSQWESGPVRRTAADPTLGFKKPSAPAASPEGVRPPAPGDIELVVHVGSSWRRLELPWGADADDKSAAGSFSAFWLVGEGNSLSMFAFDQAASVVKSFTTRLPVTAASAGGSSKLSTAWTSSTWSLTDVAGRTLPKPDLIARVDDVIVGAAWNKGSGGELGELRLFLWTPLGSGRGATGVGGANGAVPQELPRVTGVPAKHRVVPMSGSGRVAVVWAEEPAARDQTTTPPVRTDGGAAQVGAGGGTGRIGFQIREISIATGAVLYAGPLRADYWLTMREYQLLALMLVLVMGSIVVFVLRADPAAAPTLPTGVSLAEPGRRALAAAIDFLPAALLVEALWSLPSGTLLLPSRMAGEQFSLLAMLVAMTLACTHTTLSEWAFGRSLGKLLTGCAVAGVRRPAPTSDVAGKPIGAGAPELVLGRPAFWQCLVRNLVKWLAPALGLFILFDPSRRHPGDVLARTLVLLTQVTKPQ